MPASTRRSLLRAATLVPVAALAFLPSLAQTRQAPQKPHRLVIQVTDSDPARWLMALNNTRNAQTDMGGPSKIDIEIVAYGPGVNMLKKDSPVAGRIVDMVQNGVVVVACQNTMKGLGLTRDDMLPVVGYVPAGITELMKKQEEGWAYARP